MVHIENSQYIFDNRLRIVSIDEKTSTEGNVGIARRYVSNHCATPNHAAQPFVGFRRLYLSRNLNLLPCKFSAVEAKVPSVYWHHPDMRRFLRRALGHTSAAVLYNIAAAYGEKTLRTLNGLLFVICA